MVMFVSLIKLQANEAEDVRISPNQALGLAKNLLSMRPPWSGVESQ